MNRAEPQKVPELIEEQKRCLRSSNRRERTVGAFLNYCTLGSRLRSLTDKQVAQLVFDVVLNELGLMSPAMPLCVEAAERLFRSPAGVRAETEWFNKIELLPDCPKCGQQMLHHVGLDEPDYRECVSLTCGYKVEENND